MLPDPAGRTLRGGGDDPTQSMMFMQILPQSILHGLDPFKTDFIHFPHGINLMWNAYMPFLDLVAAPITLTLGPVVAYNTLLVFGPALTAWTAYFWLRRHVDRSGPAVVGGLIVGFSPYLIGHATVHVDKAWLIFVPIILMLLEDLLWRRPRSQRRTGIYLGVVTALEALISQELVLLATVGIICGVVSVLVLWRMRAVRRIVESVPGLVWAVVAFLVVYGYPLYRQLSVDRFHDLNATWWSAQPQDWIVPTTQRMIRGPQSLTDWAAHTSNWETGGYIGVPLIGALIAISVWQWHRPAVRVAAIATPLTMIMSLGDQLRLGTHKTGIWLPWDIFASLPAFKYVLPIRIALATSFGMAILVAIGLDEVWKRYAGRARNLAVAGIAVSLVFLVPGLANVGLDTRVPPYFTSDAVKQIPWGSRTMILPLGLPPERQFSMLWNAEADGRFRDIGGAAKRPAGRDGQFASPYPVNGPLVDWAWLLTDGKEVSPAQTAAAREWLVDNGIQYILVAEDWVWSHTLDRVEELVGEPATDHTGRVYVWDLEKLGVIS